MVWLNVLIFPVPFNVQGCSVRLRVDVGTDPYIETIRACHSTYRPVSEGGGRLVAAPTGYIIFIRAIVVRGCSPAAHFLEVMKLTVSPQGGIILPAAAASVMGQRPVNHELKQSLSQAGQQGLCAHTVCRFRQSFQIPGILQKASGRAVPQTLRAQYESEMDLLCH